MLSSLSRRSVLGGLGAAAVLLVTPVAGASAALKTPARGVNISLWFDQDDGSSLSPEAEVLSFLRDSGFDSVRLPLSPVRFNNAGYDELEQLAGAVGLLNRHGLHVTLDLHPLGSFRDALEDGPEVETVLMGAWSKLSKLATDFDPGMTALELLNEPPMWQDRWLPLRDRLAEIVRRNTSQHRIIWGANRYQRIDETLVCPLLADSNASVAVHYYSPMSFTHQCQNWGGQSQVSGGETFPTAEWGMADIAQDFLRLADWSAANNISVSVNEFGTLGFCSDEASRSNWTKAVRSAAERHGFGWAYWELDRGFGFLESRTDTTLTSNGILQSLVGDLR